MASIRLGGLLASVLGLAQAACGDDSGAVGSTTGNASTGLGTTGALDDGDDDGSTPATTSGMPESTGDASTTGPEPADSSGGDTAAASTSTSTGEASESGGEASTTDASGSSSEGSDAGSESSSSDGATVPGCEMCGEDEVCVVNESFVTMFDCQPIPAGCEGDVDCDCGADLCQDPFVACFDPPQSDTLHCVCIAC